MHKGTVQVYLRWVDAAGNDVVSGFPVATSVGTGPQTLAVSGVAPSGATHARFWICCTTSLTCD